MFPQYKTGFNQLAHPLFFPSFPPPVMWSYPLFGVPVARCTPHGIDDILGSKPAKRGETQRSDTSLEYSPSFAACRDKGHVPRDLQASDSNPSKNHACSFSPYSPRSSQNKSDSKDFDDSAPDSSQKNLCPSPDESGRGTDADRESQEKVYEDYHHSMQKFHALSHRYSFVAHQRFKQRPATRFGQHCTYKGFDQRKKIDDSLDRQEGCVFFKNIFSLILYVLFL